MQRAEIVLTALMAGAFFTPAFSESVPTKAPAYRHAVAPPVSDWTGSYIGIHGGHGSTDFHTDEDQTIASQFGSTPQPEGFILGGQTGYNWQFGSLVSGLEGDFSGAGMKSSQSIQIPEIGFSLALDTKVDELASVRARVGFLVLPAVLVYGTGGIGWAHSTVTFLASSTATQASAESDTNSFGWVAGAGTEWKVWDHLLLRAEYLHYDLGKQNYRFSSTNPAVLNVAGTNAALTTNVIRGGVTYNF